MKKIQVLIMLFSLSLLNSYVKASEFDDKIKAAVISNFTITFPKNLSLRANTADLDKRFLTDSDYKIHVEVHGEYVNPGKIKDHGATIYTYTLKNTCQPILTGNTNFNNNTRFISKESSFSPRSTDSEYFGFYGLYYVVYDIERIDGKSSPLKGIRCLLMDPTKTSSRIPDFYATHRPSDEYDLNRTIGNQLNKATFFQTTYLYPEQN